jgi:hypothetical protein
MVGALGGRDGASAAPAARIFAQAWRDLVDVPLVEPQIANGSAALSVGPIEEREGFSCEELSLGGSAVALHLPFAPGPEQRGAESFGERQVVVGYCTASADLGPGGAEEAREADQVVADVFRTGVGVDEPERLRGENG